jgi:uncharacterized protein YbbC (DUF1343 family)
MVRHRELVLILSIVVGFVISCTSQTTPNIQKNIPKVITPGANQLQLYLPHLKGKKVGIMANQTSVVGSQHLVDVLIEQGVDVRFAFAPEHGFRGQVERGESFKDGKDATTGIPVYSLYGKQTLADSLVQSIDVLVFDLQDVGARFYTYITSLHELMEWCVKYHKTLLILDRPNPNGDQIDGPVRSDDAFKSNVSYHKIAMVHGLTVGELAKMINGEGWLTNQKKCELIVIPVKNYDHSMQYVLPVQPSPSLPNFLSVRLYPSLCLFEATNFSVGRGTDWPFQVIGYPDTTFGSFTFTPQERSGMSLHVEGQHKVNYGVDLRALRPESQKFTLKYLLDFYNKSPNKAGFFSNPSFFDKLAGTDVLRKQIVAGWSEERIRASWQAELAAYKKMRHKYLLYPDSSD